MCIIKTTKSEKTMKHLHLIQLEAIELNSWQEFLIESDVVIPPQQQHLIARISANKLIESLGHTPIENSLQDEKDKVFFSLNDDDLNIQTDKFVQIKNISEISAENAYDLFTGDDRPKVIAFDPLKTLYAELEMLPLDDMDGGESTQRLRLWFKGVVFSNETDHTSIVFTHDADGYYPELEYRELITDAMDQAIKDFIKDGHKDDLSIRFD